MKFRVRTVKPEISRWYEIEASSYLDAIQDVHSDSVPNHGYGGLTSLVYHDRSDGGRTDVHFALFEVEGVEGRWVSRVFYKGIWRKGGVRTKPEPTLQDIAKALEWTHKPEELLEDGWEGEEEKYT